MADIGIFIGRQRIGQTDFSEISVKEIEPRQMTFYRRRKNKIYFKDENGKLSIELREIPKDIQELKIGTVCGIKF